jgi:nucleoside-diphosphate-sugar epimerase
MEPGAAQRKGNKILITGASGFIGGHLCTELAAAGRTVRAAVRKSCGLIQPVSEQVVTGDVGPDTNWLPALSEVDTVIHLAARSHRLDRKSGKDLASYRRINVEGTRRLAEACAASRIRRFLLLSSIKAIGECSKRGESFFEDADCHPIDPYGISKWEAEEALIKSTAGSSMEVVIIRAPLVYGPRVGANFLRLLQAIDRGTVLPLGSVDARRSLVFIRNLTSAIACSIDHPSAAGQVYHVADTKALTIKELLLQLAMHMNKSVRLLPIPVWLLHAAAAMAGRSADIRRLTDSLLVASNKIREQLDWTPPFSVEEGLSRTVEWYCSTKPAIPRISS